MFLIVAFIVALGGGMIAYRTTTGYPTEIPGRPTPAQVVPNTEQTAVAAPAVTARQGHETIVLPVSGR